MDQVQAMRIFTRIVELGSFSRAAERLQLPRATVSNALKRLEQRLGVRLLIRTTRQVQVTSEGSLYYQRCVQLLGALEEADTLFSHHKLQPSGKVRIDMPHSLARQIVIPALDDFYRRYPDITRRWAPTTPTSICCAKAWTACCAPGNRRRQSGGTAHRPAAADHLRFPAYLQACGTPLDIDSLASHRAVGYFSWPATAITRWNSAAAAKWNCANSPRLSVSGADAIAGARAGMGLIQAARYSLALAGTGRTGGSAGGHAAAADADLHHVSARPFPGATGQGVD